MTRETTMPTTNESLLRSRIGLILPELLAASKQLGDHPRYGELYTEHLFLLHSMVRASVSLMEAALSKLRQMDEVDDVGRLFETYLESHIPEEQGHDEWLLTDLETLGVSRASVLDRRPSTEIAAAVGAQYYWINHFQPIALIGYIAVLEGYPPSESTLRRQIVRTGIPEQAFKTLIKHARLDIGHSKELGRCLDQMPLTDSHFAIIGTSAFHTVKCVSTAIRKIVREEEFSDRESSSFAQTSH